MSTSEEKFGGKNRRCFDINVKMLYCLGLWPSERAEVRNFYYYWRYLYPRAEIFRLFYSLIFQAINVSIVWGNVMLITEYALAFGIHAIIFTKFTTLFYYRYEIKQQCLIIESLNDPNMFYNEYMKTKIAKRNKLAHYFSKYLVFATFVATVCVSIVVISQGLLTRRMPFRLWFPYETKHSPVFEITMIFSTLATVFDMTLISICDSIFVSQAWHIIAQFELLQYKLRNLTAHVEETIKTKVALGRHLVLPSESVCPVIVDTATVEGVASGSAAVGTDVRVQERGVENKELTKDDITETEVDVIVGVAETNELKLEQGTDLPVENMNRYKDIKDAVLLNAMNSYLAHCIKHHRSILQ